MRLLCPEVFEEERAKLDLAPTIMKEKVELQEAALIVLNVGPELVATEKLLTRNSLALFG